MSGYPAEAAGCTPKAGLICIHCERFLREPVQTEDGLRVCKACFILIKKLPDGICTECGASTSGAYYPDRAVKREVLALLVVCSNKQHGCQWQGPLSEWELHCSMCSFKAQPCPNDGCSEMLSQKDLEQHLQDCQYRLTPCEHCLVEMPFCDIENHNSSCPEAPVICEEKLCGMEVRRKDLPQHKSHQCKVVTCLTCSAKVDRQSGVDLPLPQSECRGGPASPPHPPQSSSEDVPSMRSSRALSVPDCTRSAAKPHLSDPVQVFQHHQALAERVQKVEEDMVGIKEVTDAVSEKTKEDINQLKEENGQLRSEFKDIKSSISELTAAVHKLSTDLGSHDKPVLSGTHFDKLEAVVRSDAENTRAVQQVKKELRNLHDEVESVKSKARQSQLPMVQADGTANLQGFGGRDTQSLLSKDSGVRSAAYSQVFDKGSMDSTSESRLQAMEKRLEELMKQLTIVKVHGQELELQLQASLASTHNGSFLWRIPDVARRRREAIDERVTSIYSPPFYTGRNGYKMCIRAYLNGDGMGYKTHLSLFFVLMRGECDPLLKWPFEYKVSMILVDQTHRKHIVQTFKPTPESSSFHQPITDMNVASGCPQFAKLTVFDDSSYVTDDIMFIKCIVDTTKIFHP